MPGTIPPLGTAHALASGVTPVTAPCHGAQHTVGPAQSAASPSAPQRTLWIYAAAALVALVILSIVASATAYFGFDVVITRWIQLTVPAPLGIALDDVSWIGFPPEVDLILGAIGVAIFLVGYRWEAICVTLAGLVGGASWFIMAPLVHRPRPAPDLVHVEQLLGSGSYPSGH